MVRFLVAGLKAVNDAGMKETDNGSNLGLILGIAIPAGILVIVVPIVIFLAYKRYVHCSI